MLEETVIREATVYLVNLFLGMLRKKEKGKIEEELTIIVKNPDKLIELIKETKDTIQKRIKENPAVKEKYFSLPPIKQADFLGAVTGSVAYTTGTTQLQSMGISSSQVESFMNAYLDRECPNCRHPVVFSLERGGTLFCPNCGWPSP